MEGELADEDVAGVRKPIEAKFVLLAILVACFAWGGCGNDSSVAVYDQWKLDMSPEGLAVISQLEERLRGGMLPSLADPEKEVAVRYLVAVRIVIEVNDLKDAVLQPLKPGSPKENAERSETWAGLWDSAHNLLVNLEVPEAFAQAHPVLVRGVSGLASGSRDLGRAFRDSAEPSRLNEIAQEIFDSYESVQDAINLIADEEVAYFPPGGLFNSMNNPQP